MKKTIKRKALILAAAMVMSASAFAMPLTGFAATVSNVPTNVQLVTKKGNLTVTIPENISTDISISAYEMLQLVVPKDSAQPDAMTNTNDSKNVYVVTAPWENFFAAAKTAYTATSGTVISDQNNLYLTYDTQNNYLVLSASRPTGNADKDYIEIDNAPYQQDNATHQVTHIGRLEKTYFEADLVSRIVSTPAGATETTASAARLLSDWASRYVKANDIAADKTVAAPTERSSTLTDLTYGYYIVIASDESDTAEGATAINQSILNVPDNSSVNLKATPITVDKSVDNLLDANKINNNETNKKNSESTKYNTATPAATTGYDKITANIGDVLQYKIESHIPSMRSYDFAAHGTRLLGITNDDEITEANFAVKTAANEDRFMFVMKDKMINQDLIAEDTTIRGIDVDGMKMEVKDTDGSLLFTGVVKKVTVDDVDGLYIVKASEKDSVTAANVASKAYGRLWESGYVVNSGSGSTFFAVNLVLPKLKADGLDGKDVVFTYNAQLMGEAGVSGNSNSANITYSNDPFNPRSKDVITPDNNNVYTYDIDTLKVFSDGATVDQYKNVKFQLFSDEAMGHAIEFVKDSSGANDGKYTRADSDDAVKVTELAVNTTDGTLQLHGLGEGTYYLKEMDNQALKDAGYNIANVITVTITAKKDGDILDTTNFDLYEGAEKGCAVTRDQVNLEYGAKDNNQYSIKFDVLNQKGFHLPLTGEYGNWLLAVGGILLVAVGGTVIILINRKKGGAAAA